MTVSLLRVVSQHLRRGVIDGEDREKMVAFLAFLFAIFLLVELALAKVIDFSALLRWI